MILKREYLKQMFEHCRAEYPKEACGILAGKDNIVARVYQMTNLDQSSTTYYIEPKEQFKVMKEMRTEGWEMLGIYHSHVATAAYPSPTDIKLAFYPDALYLIISLANFDEPVIKAYHIREGEIEEEEIEIVED